MLKQRIDTIRITIVHIYCYDGPIIYIGLDLLFPQFSWDLDIQLIYTYTGRDSHDISRRTTWIGI